MKALVVGYGNSLRSDDGIGPHVARAIDSLNLPDVETRSLHQLNPELVDEFSKYDLVCLIDAAQDGPPVHVRTTEERPAGRPSTHHFGPDDLLQLARAIGMRAPDMLLCTVRGENFEVGETLSSVVLGRAREAVEKIVRALRPA